MGAVYIQLNNSFIKRPITNDYTDPISLLGASDKDLCTNSQTVIYGEISVCNAGLRARLPAIKPDVKHKTSFRNVIRIKHTTSVFCVVFRLVLQFRKGKYFIYMV